MNAFAALLVALPLSGVLAFVLYKVIETSWLLWRLRSIPGPKQHWLFGNALDIVYCNSRPHKVWQGWINQHGPVCQTRFLDLIAVLVADPVVASKMLDRSGYDGVFVNKFVGIFKLMNAMNGASRLPNLVTQETNEYWRAVRKSTARAFSMDAVRQHFPDVMHCVNKLAGLIRLSGPDADLDMDELAIRLTMDVIGRVGFQQDFCCLENPEAEILSSLNAALYEVGFRFRNPYREFFFWDKEVQNGKRDVARFNKACEQLVDRLLARGKPAQDDCSIWAQLMRVRDPATDKPLTKQQLQAEVAVFLVGGYDTTGHTIAWTLMLIATHDDVRSKVLHELDQLGLLVTPQRPHPRSIDFKDLSALEYLNAVIKESMRLIPVTAMATGRVVTTQDIVIKGYTIPKNVPVIFPTFILQNHPDYWDEPQQFKPERWLGTGDGAKCSSSELKYMPFSYGARDCIGQNIARTELTAVLASLLSQFDMTLSDGRSYNDFRDSEVVKFLLQPANGVRMRAVPRAAGLNGKA